MRWWTLHRPFDYRPPLHETGAEDYVLVVGGPLLLAAARLTAWYFRRRSLRRRGFPPRPRHSRS